MEMELVSVCHAAVWKEQQPRRRHQWKQYENHENMMAWDDNTTQQHNIQDVERKALSLPRFTRRIDIPALLLMDPFPPAKSGDQQH